jgi:hypothetical protein
MTEKRKYTIHSHPTRFWTGHRPNGEQVIAGPMLPNILVYLFDRDGRFLRREIVPVANPPAWNAEESKYVPRPGFFEELEAEVNAVLGRFGVAASPIAVEAFFDDEQSVGILDLPSEYSLFLEDPSQADDEEEAASFRESIAEWNSKGKFVLVWGPELWMNKQGKLISS